ncbi:MAG: hypothetical protein V3U90_08445 [Dehalococcoidia bacterium]
METSLRRLTVSDAIYFGVFPWTSKNVSLVRDIVLIVSFALIIAGSAQIKVPL